VVPKESVKSSQISSSWWNSSDLCTHLWRSWRVS